MNLDFLQNNPELNNIDPKKLEFLMNLASENPPTNTKDMANVLMGAASNAKKNNMEFTPDETDLLIGLLKQNMSPQEQKKADQILMLMKTMRHK